MTDILFSGAIYKFIPQGDCLIGSLADDRDADPDEDSYTNIEEYRSGTHPLEKDEAKELPPEIPSDKLDEDKLEAFFRSDNRRPG